MPAPELSTLSDAELIDRMRDARQRAAMASASEVMTVAELAHRREVEARTGGASPLEAGEFVSDEVALALTVTGCAAADLVRIGLMLRARLPATRTAFEAGLIDLPRVKMIVNALIGVAIPVARRAERTIVDLAPTLTTGQLRHRIQRALIQADPDAARKRTSTALKDRRIEAFDNPDGTADLIGRSLPADRVAAIRDRLTSTARALRASGDGRPMQAIRADLAMDWLQGTPTGTAAGPAPAEAMDTGLIEPVATPTRKAPGTPAPVQTTARPAQTATTPAPRHGPLTVAATTTHTGTTPAMPPVISVEGPRQAAPPDPIRASNAPPAPPDAIHVSPASPNAVRAPNAPPTPPGSSNHTTQNTPPTTATNRTSNTPPTTATNRTSNTPPTTRGGAAHTTDVHGAETADPWSREDVLLLVEQVIGKTIAHTADRVLKRLLADAAPGGLQALLRAAITRIEQAVEPLRTSWCRVADPGTHEDGRYRPAARTRRQVESRYTTCAFPTCNKRAGKCDIDHTTPWHENGPTCICNLAPLCRHHHRLKQHPRWRLTQPWPGVTIWTTPAEIFHIADSYEGRIAEIYSNYHQRHTPFRQPPRVAEDR